ncbi:DUF3105 domain-containing protein [Streptomyces megasporus]|uniref:DUF3105 domain-containing protein n=1 Tax=Streptomyces megasporus TaxID=44060 RepID=UPI0004E218D6|nr:DUF3105 domain-containing protein [Streptomyces megasporus]
MGSAKSTSKTAARRARIEEIRRAERARERRNRILTITAGMVVLVSLIAFVSYLVTTMPDEKSSTASTAAGPVRGEKTWDIDTLGRNHVAEKVDYPMTPPAGGDHHQVWMNCQGDVYDKPVANENAVHSLEHGAVWVTHNAKAAEADVQKLKDKVAKTSYTLMSPVPDQQGKITLTAWGHQLTVDTASDPRIEEFLSAYVQGEQTPEPGAACTGGMGTA